MLENLNYLAENGYDCYCICNNNNILTTDTLGKVRFIPINMGWGAISPLTFIKSIYALYKLFKEERFDAIQYATSNASLVSSIAGWLAKIPVRINLQWGISYPIYKGWKRWLFYYGNIITCRLSTSIQPDSFGNLMFSIDNKLYPPQKGTVIFNGSACGVNLEKYNVNKRNEWRQIIYSKYNLDRFKMVFGFVGRVVVEKGINELLEAFININRPDTCLLIVGSLDDVQRLDQAIYQKSLNQNNIFFIGTVPNTAAYYAAMDFLILPSYQEGFGMTILEAAGVGTPSIISNIKGPTELIKEGINGFICEPRSMNDLRITMLNACKMSKNDYTLMANNAYEIVKRDFDSVTFKKLFLENRNKLLEEKNIL